MRSTLVAVLIACGSLTYASTAPTLTRETRTAVEREHELRLVGRVEVDSVDAKAAIRAGRFARPVRTILDVRSPLRYGEYRWSDAGVPAGPLWITIDLHQQLISVFRGSHEIGTAVILYGARSNRTPAGIFPILAKIRDHRSVTYDGAPMPYTLRLTRDGVSIHGSNVRAGYATHGCIGVPIEFAAKLFEVASKGDQVIIVAGAAGE